MLDRLFHAGRSACIISVIECVSSSPHYVVSITEERVVCVLFELLGSGALLTVSFPLREMRVGKLHGTHSRKHTVEPTGQSMFCFCLPHEGGQNLRMGCGYYTTYQSDRYVFHWRAAYWKNEMVHWAQARLLGGEALE